MRACIYIKHCLTPTQLRSLFLSMQNLCSRPMCVITEGRAKEEPGSTLMLCANTHNGCKAINPDADLTPCDSTNVMAKAQVQKHDNVTV